MNIKTLFYSVPIAIIVMCTSGCTTQVDNYFEVETRQFSPLKENTSAKTVYINSITDNRTFIEAESTITPNVETLSHYTANKKATKERIIARNQTISPCTVEKSVANCTANSKSYSALAENLCFKKFPAKEYVKKKKKKGFEDAGYKVLSHKTDITETSVIVDVSLDRYWYWLDYNGTDRIAYNEIISSFKTYNKKTGKTSTFKVSNTTTLAVPDFMNPLKGRIESSLKEYAAVISKNVNTLVK